jgi:hypothetical protein
MHIGRMLAVLAGVAVLAAGCGTERAQEGDLLAATANTSGQSARLAGTTTLQVPGKLVSLTVTGEFDFAQSRGMLRTQGPGGAVTETLFIPPKIYLRIPAGVHGPLPRGKSWMALPDSGSGVARDAFLGPFGGMNPGDLLSSLTAISSSVTKLGSATIRGVPVTGYRVNVDPAKADSRLPRSERAGFGAFARTLGTGTLPVEVWVDHHNLVRQIRVSLSLPGGPARARITQTLDFYDFGVPVRVSAPPAADVASFSQLGRASGSAAAGAGPPRPPRVSGTLSPAQAAAAEQAVRAFWSALASNNTKAVARTVLPAQRTCVQPTGHEPRFTVTSLRIISARPAGKAMATVRFSVKAQARVLGHSIPMFPQGPGHVEWLLTAQVGGHWYVDLAASSAGPPVGPACQ